MPPRPSHLARNTAIILLFTFALLIFLNCSGLRFPLLRPRHTLASSLQSELNLSLPPSTIVQHNARVASRDPAIFYVLTMTPTEADAFASNFKPTDPQPNFYIPFSAPAWWTPTAHPNMQSYQAAPSSQQSAYYLFHTPGDKTLYLLWIAF